MRARDASIMILYRTLPFCNVTTSANSAFERQIPGMQLARRPGRVRPVPWCQLELKSSPEPFRLLAVTGRVQDVNHSLYDS